MSRYRKDTGAFGEELAVTYLKQKGYLIRNRNFTSHWAELDIVAQKADKIIFIEVKTKTDDKTGKPYESVTPRKIHSLKRAIDFYLLQNDLKKYKLSLDVISIILNEDKSIREFKHFESLDVKGW